MAEFDRVVDHIADSFAVLATKAEPQAKLLGGATRGVAVGGLVGGVLGAIGLALPGFGLVDSAVVFVAALVLAAGAAALVWRWGTRLRAWSGDVTAASRELRALPGADEAWRDVAGALRTVGGRSGPGAAVMQLVRGGRRMWKLRRSIGGAKDVVVGLTGPFRPPLVGLRFAALAGGMAVIAGGPLLLLVAAIV